MFQVTSTHFRIIGVLGISQICSWGSIYYAITLLAKQIMAEMHWSPEIVFGAFSLSLLVSGITSTSIGKALDRFGGRIVMCLGSLLNALGLFLLASENSLFAYFGAWILLGVGMSMTLYDAAFATIVESWKSDNRRAISLLTLFGGFASTIFWPLTLYLDSKFGWRGTYLIYSILQLGLCFPLHLLLDKFVSQEKPNSISHFNVNFQTHLSNEGKSSNCDSTSICESTSPRLTDQSSPLDGTTVSYSLRQAMTHPSFWKLALAFATNSFIFSALSIHFIPTLEKLGHLSTWAVLMSTLIGPMQVLGRIFEMNFHRYLQVDTVGLITFSSLPLGLLFFFFFGTHQVAIILFCIFYGLSNGVITIVKGTLPQSIFGIANYGAISGALTSPSLFARAGGPLIMAVVVHNFTSPFVFVGILLVCSIVSLLLFRSALHANRSC